MKDICSKKDCCGCRACENICPVKAIVMKEDEKGFIRPVINENICINCGLCKKVCPIISKEILRKPIKVYACKNINERVRISSSSGGIFEELSKAIFKEDGSVYGAGFSKKNKVEHMRAKDLDELETLKKSKYVQSNMRATYEEIKKDLKDDKEIIFSGTPCQVNAVKNFFNKSIDKLYLVDIVCHGVPSPKIFEDYKLYLEKKFNSKIDKINFRYKNEKSTQNIKIDFKDGTSYLSNRKEGDYFCRLFIEDIILRDSCYDCRYKSFNRCGDITLADFWGIEKEHPDFYSHYGNSAIIINNNKGKFLFDSIKNQIDYISTDINKIIKYNKNLQQPSKRYYDRSSIYLNLEKKNFDRYIKEDLKFKKDFKVLLKSLLPYKVKLLIRNVFLNRKKKL